MMLNEPFVFLEYIKLLSNITPPNDIVLVSLLLTLNIFHTLL